MRFSERFGFKPLKTVIQIDSVDDDLRNALWSALKLEYWDTIVENTYGGQYLSGYGNEDLNTLCRRLWLDFFKKALDTLPNDWQKVYKILREFFFLREWYEVYDLIEFVAQNHPRELLNEHFMRACNAFLEREVSAYRFVDARVVRIVSEEEITAVEEALRVKVPPVREHLNRALQMLSDRRNPDYRNTIKESVSAVEALVKTVTKSDKGTLGDLLKELERQGKLHPALKSAFSSLYGYTSDADGIRHALLEEDPVTFEQAKFMLVACSAFTNYAAGMLRR
jgi:hypothetical protein